MSSVRRVLLALAVGGLVIGCGVIPTPLLDGQLIVMEVANRSPRPAILVVAASGDQGRIVGSVEPASVPAGQTVTVRFSVPPTGSWAIWANGGELMGESDLKGRRGDVQMGIDIGPDGTPSWWCQANCP